MSIRLRSIAVSLVLLLPPAVSAQEAVTVASKRECAVCHIASMSDFKQTAVATLVPYDPEPMTEFGRVNVESTERMCFSCHDGFMKDARFLWSERQNTHPVGVKPSSHITLPERDGRPVYPLSSEGKMFCGTCHFAHGLDWGHTTGGMQSPIFMRARNVESSLCISCHQERSTGPRDGNHPIHKRLDHIPPELKAVGSKFGKDQTIICQSCHRPHGAPDKRLLVVANPDSRLCGECHEKRYAHDATEAARFGTHPVNVIPTGHKIPDAIFKMGGNVAPDGRIICQSCHKQHLAVPGTHLLIQNNDDSALCRNCHEKEFAIEDSKHNMKRVDPDLLNERNVAVSAGGVCSSCHVPHGGLGPKMWARDIFTFDDPMSHTCLGCHSESGIANEKLLGAYTHPVGVPLAASRDKHEGLPVFSLEGVKRNNGERGYVTCASCHDIHQSNAEATGEDTPARLERITHDKFLRPAAINRQAMCVSCHDDKAAIAGTEHDIGIKAPRERNIVHLTTEEGGVCSACHVPHNGNGPAMWARRERQGIGVEGLCLDCHRKRGLAKEKVLSGNDHPLHIDPHSVGVYTDLPLFNDAGERDLKGMVDCATCHNPHRWSPLPAAEIDVDLSDVEGDATNSFLRLPATDDKDTLCVACHADQAWVAGSDHDLSITAPAVTNVLGENVAHSGICGQCHIPHDSANSLVLWARTPGEGQDAMDALCRSCHEQGRTAATKAPSRLVHPQTMVPIVAGPLSRRRTGLPDDTTLPVYTLEGKKTTFGLITCPTCHDPHLWDARRPNYGPGHPSDGTIFNSFLRITDTSFFYCAACHGVDSLFRYKYFHWEKYKHFHWEDVQHSNGSSGIAPLVPASAPTESGAVTAPSAPAPGASGTRANERNASAPSQSPPVMPK